MRVAPAVQAGIESRVWSTGELVGGLAESSMRNALTSVNTIESELTVFILPPMLTRNPLCKRF